MSATTDPSIEDFFAPILFYESGFDQDGGLGTEAVFSRTATETL